MTRHDEIKGAYKVLGKEDGFYDGMMTCSSVLGTAVSKLVWGIGKEKNEAYIEKAYKNAFPKCTQRSASKPWRVKAVSCAKNKGVKK
ncbi:MAG: hypothetical protein Q4E53_06270 [Eubacteriales bacterium]|nr:hypothetical protein [Eubacteriales bacterium]